MQNSRSQAKITHGFERTHSQRIFYVNDQLNYSKDISTIFHSPYKDGKKNTNFTNPTFLSSNLFYGEQVSKEQTPKHNLIYNKNQRSRKQLYDKRMQKADNVTVSIHQAVAANIQSRQRSRKVNDESQQPLVRSRSRLRNKNDQLTKQLQILLKHREHDQKKQKTSRIYTQSNQQNIKPQTPIYSQKNRLQTQEKANIQNRRNLQQWMAISDKIKKMKDWAGIQNRKIETRAMDNYIVDNGHRKYEKQLQSRKNAGMLASILRQQIKQSHARKEQQRKQRASFY